MNQTMNNIPRRFRDEIGVERLHGVYQGMVRGTVDPQGNGRLTVWISDFGPDENDSYVTVEYAPPFAGATSIGSTPDGASTEGQISYGWWATPPDIDNLVLCCFVNGDITRGYWFACLYQTNMNHMVPGIGSQRLGAELADTQTETFDEGNDIPSPAGVPAEQGDDGVILNRRAKAVAEHLFGSSIEFVDGAHESPLASSGAEVDCKPIENVQFATYVRRYTDAGYTVIEAINKTDEGGGEGYWHVVLGEKGSAQYPDTSNENDGEVRLPSNAAQNLANGGDGLANSGSAVPDRSDDYGSKFGPYGPPRIEYDKRDKSITSPTSKAAGADTIPRGVFEPLANGLIEQGLDADKERGVSNTSARRESPSRVYGLLSPRGNTIHIDDGNVEEGNEFIRIRTRSGAQILVHESSGYIYMNSKLGKSWVEISDDGIDMFSEGPISLASKGDVNISSGGSTNIQAADGVKVYTTDILAHAQGSMNFTAEKDFLAQAYNDTFFIAANNFGAGAGGQIGLDAGGDIRAASCGANVRKATAILDNSPGAPTPVDATEPEDTGAVLSRQPTHEPFERGASNVTHIDDDGQAYTEVVGSDGSVSQEPVEVDVNATDEDWLTVCVIEEARGESNDGQACVAAVILNRTRGFSEGNKPPAGTEGTVKGVVLAYKQFSWLNSGGPNAKARETFGLNRIAHWKSKPQWQKTNKIVKDVIARTHSGGAGYRSVLTQPKCYWYHTTYVNPSWNRNLRKLAKVGGHIFWWSPTGRS